MRHDCNEAVPDRLMADANRNDKLHPHCEAGRLNTLRRRLPVYEL